MIQSLPPDFFSFNITDVISGILTLALVLLYWRMQQLQEEMASVQEKQADIMERQTDFMQANHEPLIEVENLKGKDGSIILTITNRGNGPARNLLMQTVVYKQNELIDEEPVELEPGYQGEGSVIGPEWAHLWKVPPQDSKEDEMVDGPNDGIGVRDSPTEFTSDVLFTYMSPGTGKYEVTFSEMMERISKEWDCDHISMDFHIAYTNVAWELNAVSVGSVGNVPVRSDTTIEEALKDPQVGTPLNGPVSEEEVASMIMMDDINIG